MAFGTGEDMTKLGKLLAPGIQWVGGKTGV